MKSTNTGKVAAVLASCSTGIFLAMMATASPAVADPSDPDVPPASDAAVPGPPSAATVQAAGTDASSPPPDGVPHLASPDALPPGSTLDAQDTDSPNVSYFKDLWEAVQSHQISAREALIMGAAQRGMDTPYPEQAPGPNVPRSPGNPPVPPPDPVPPAPPTP